MKINVGLRGKGHMWRVDKQKKCRVDRNNSVKENLSHGKAKTADSQGGRRGKATGDGEGGRGVGRGEGR